MRIGIPPPASDVSSCTAPPGGCQSDAFFANVVNPWELCRKPLQSCIGPGVRDLVLSCRKGLFSGRFLYVNRAEGELFGSAKVDEDVTVVIDHSKLSPRHCAISLDPSSNRYLLRDLGSSGGTWVRLRDDKGIRICAGQLLNLNGVIFKVVAAKESLKDGIEAITAFLRAYDLEDLFPPLIQYFNQAGIRPTLVALNNNSNLFIQHLIRRKKVSAEGAALLHVALQDLPEHFLPLNSRGIPLKLVHPDDESIVYAKIGWEGAYLCLCNDSGVVATEARFAEGSSQTNFLANVSRASPFGGVPPGPAPFAPTRVVGDIGTQSNVATDARRNNVDQGTPSVGSSTALRNERDATEYVSLGAATSEVGQPDDAQSQNLSAGWSPRGDVTKLKGADGRGYAESLESFTKGSADWVRSTLPHFEGGSGRCESKSAPLIRQSFPKGRSSNQLRSHIGIAADPVGGDEGSQRKQERSMSAIHLSRLSHSIHFHPPNLLVPGRVAQGGRGSPHLQDNKCVARSSCIVAEYDLFRRNRLRPRVYSDVTHPCWNTRRVLAPHTSTFVSEESNDLLKHPQGSVLDVAYSHCCPIVTREALHGSSPPHSLADSTPRTPPRSTTRTVRAPPLPREEPRPSVERFLSVPASAALERHSAVRLERSVSATPACAAPSSSSDKFKEKLRHRTSSASTSESQFFDAVCSSQPAPPPRGTTGGEEDLADEVTTDASSRAQSEAAFLYEDDNKAELEDKGSVPCPSEKTKELESEREISEFKAALRAWVSHQESLSHMAPCEDLVSFESPLWDSDAGGGLSARGLCDALFASRQQCDFAADKTKSGLTGGALLPLKIAGLTMGTAAGLLNAQFSPRTLTLDDFTTPVPPMGVTLRGIPLPLPCLVKYGVGTATQLGGISGALFLKPDSTLPPSESQGFLDAILQARRETSALPPPTTPGLIENVERLEEVTARVREWLRRLRDQDFVEKMQNGQWGGCDMDPLPATLHPMNHHQLNLALISHSTRPCVGNLDQPPLRRDVFALPRNCGAEVSLIVRYLQGHYELSVSDVGNSYQSHPSAMSVFENLFVKLSPFEDLHTLTPGDVVRVGDLEFAALRFNTGVGGQQGLRHSMEDEDIAIQDMAGLSRSVPCSYFAVYDGHGGRQCAEFLHQCLHRAFRQQLFLLSGALELSANIHRTVYDALFRAFVQTDRLFLQQQLKQHRRAGPGAAAVVVVILGDTLWAANCGDARAVLCRNGTALALSSDHKPVRPDEARRIEASGGFVKGRRVLGRLAVSRAFGDIEYKNVDSGRPPLVVADPEIRMERLTPDDDFLLLACDGLFDVFSSQDAIDFVRWQLSAMPPGEQDPQRVVQDLIRNAIELRRSRDNVTAIIVTFQRDAGARLNCKAHYP